VLLNPPFIPVVAPIFITVLSKEKEILEEAANPFPEQVIVEPTDVVLVDNVILGATMKTTPGEEPR
jgi:hypothetical protein